ncbi:MAG: TIGR02300 family protein [Rhodospirillales bacterium]|nr:TIGR02300 family protein [Rhodospirillales bacterium]
MAKPEWGTKRICHSCGTRFYDLLRDPIVCPSCGTEFDPEALLRTRRSRAVVSEREPAVAEAAVPEPEAAEIEAETEAAEEVEEAEEATEGEEAAVVEDAEEQEKTEEEEEEEEDVIEDASELGEDEDDMAEVIDQVDPEDR